MADEGIMLLIPTTLFEENHFFVLDTGSSITVLNESLLPKLGTPTGQVIAETPSQAELPASLYSTPNILIGNTPLQLKQIACIDLGMAQMISGEACAGILGMDVLSNYVVTMDFSKNHFTLGYNAEPPDHEAISIPMVTISEHRYGVNTVINGNHNFTLMIDSGSSVSVSLNKQDWNELFGANAEKVGRTSDFIGAGNTVRKNRIARIESLRVGTLLYTNLLCEQLTNPESVSHLGLAFLRRNSVTLDFPRKQLDLTERTDSSPEEDDMSGLHLLRKDGFVVVFAVDVGSPAENAGVKAGDQIVSVDGGLSENLNMDQIRKIFEKGDGKQVETQISRDGKTFGVTITLKRFI